MALYTAIASGNWHSQAATVWDLGAEPGPTDTFTIAGYTVTKDDDKGGTADAASGTIGANGKLVCGTGAKLKITGALTLSADTSWLDVASGYADIGDYITFSYAKGKLTGGNDGYLSTWRFASNTVATIDIEASSGHVFTLKVMANTYDNAFYGSGYGGGLLILKFVDVETGGTSRYLTVGFMIRGVDTVEDCCFFYTTSSSPGCTFRLNGSAFLQRCYLYNLSYGCQPAYCYPAESLYDCVFGKRRDGTSDDNTYDLMMIGGGLHLINCDFYSVNKIRYQAGNSLFCSVGENGAIGDWCQYSIGTTVYRDASAAKSGAYGISIIPKTGSITQEVIPLDLSIAVQSGKTVAPSLWIKNVTADLGLAGAAGRMTFELDPGNEWGLKELKDASSLADPYNNWRQVVFTGGTAGGSSKKGTVLLRITLTRYVASGVVYVADLDPGVS